MGEIPLGGPPPRATPTPWELAMSQANRLAGSLLWEAATGDPCGRPAPRGDQFNPICRR
jgi:hypothetical protein